jgi:hypothetical protein
VARVVGDTSFLFNFTAPRKRIEVGHGAKEPESVRVKVGDPVSITVADRADATTEGA